MKELDEWIRGEFEEVNANVEASHRTLTENMNALRTAGAGAGAGVGATAKPDSNSAAGAEPAATAAAEALTVGATDGGDAVDKATFATWASAQKAQLADLDRRLSSSIAHSSAISAKLSERVTVRSRLSKPTQQPPDARGSHG